MFQISVYGSACPGRTTSPASVTSPPPSMVISQSFVANGSVVSSLATRWRVWADKEEGVAQGCSPKEKVRR
jgi:hypothetical protein